MTVGKTPEAPQSGNPARRGFAAPFPRRTIPCSPARPHATPPRTESRPSACKALPEPTVNEARSQGVTLWRYPSTVASVDV
jgi:hypothetical protein